MARRTNDLKEAESFGSVVFWGDGLFLVGFWWILLERFLGLGVFVVRLPGFWEVLVVLSFF